MQGGGGSTRRAEGACRCGGCRYVPVCEACQEEFLDEAEDVQEVERIWLWEALKARVAAWDEWWGIGAEENDGTDRPRRGWSVGGVDVDRHYARYVDGPWGSNEGARIAVRARVGGGQTEEQKK